MLSLFPHHLHMISFLFPSVTLIDPLQTHRHHRNRANPGITFYIFFGLHLCFGFFAAFSKWGFGLFWAVEGSAY